MYSQLKIKKLIQNINGMNHLLDVQKINNGNTGKNAWKCSNLYPFSAISRKYTESL